jgi:xanthosine utilization system XapX-like protein
MSDQSDVVLAYWNEHRQQLRQSENQRATMTNFVLVIAAALSGLIVQQKFVTATAPLGILIALIGLFGMLVAAKYHERAEYHLSQARALTATLKELNVLTDDPNIDHFRNRHYSAFPRLHRIRLHFLWTSLHILIAAYGGTLATISLNH